MKFIIDADIENAPAVLAKMIEVLPRFRQRPSRPGWGWGYTVNGEQYFIRETKSGLSARLLHKASLSARSAAE